MESFRQFAVEQKAMPLELLKEITNNFSEERLLGSGTFGKVYKGVQDGEEIAVKLLNPKLGRVQEDLNDFVKEFENLMRLRHKNIVQLLGYCYEIKGEFLHYGEKLVPAENIYRALCFEYLHNGSLQEHLNDEYHGLDWQTRYKIIKGTCEGLKYLHEGLESPMYHLDLKPGNILLDKNMDPKLADFGLSKFVHKDQQTEVVQGPLGTSGYLPPEFIESGAVSKKFDIFSLGVVMIRIITGYEGYHKKSEMSSQEFIDLVHENWRNRLQATSCYSSLEAHCHQVRRCVEIALDCTQANRKERPTIGIIIRSLNQLEDTVKKLALCLPHTLEKCTQENETRLHMYLHQFPALPGVPNPNEHGAINSRQPIGFGQMYVHDWTLTTGLSASENVVGRLQGFHLQAGQTTTSWYTTHTIVFLAGSFAGSTLEVSGITEVKPNGQWSITGGTAAFACARGTVKFTNSQSSTATDSIKELDIHVFHTPEAAV